MKSELFFKRVSFKNDIEFVLKNKQQKIFIITDSIVEALYAQNLAQYLLSQKYQAELVSFPFGESNKTCATLFNLQNTILKRGITKNCLIIGLGGGVVTDLSGFLASTLLRGVEFVSIPTTLLGMVDACYGGKTGVNTAYGKNLIGSYYQPSKIIIDIDFLSTLSDELLLEGVVEMIKHAIIASPSHFDKLKLRRSKFLQRDPGILEALIQESLLIKKSIVKEDEFDQIGRRNILNFGHTVAHALEKTSNYLLSHGKAVAIGLRVESYLSYRIGMLSKELYEKITAILDLFELNTKIPPQLSLERVVEAMGFDKKNKSLAPSFVVIKDIGIPVPFDGTYCKEINQKRVYALLVDYTKNLSRA